MDRRRSNEERYQALRSAACNAFERLRITTVTDNEGLGEVSWTDSTVVPLEFRHEVWEKAKELVLTFHVPDAKIP